MPNSQLIAFTALDRYSESKEWKTVWMNVANQTLQASRAPCNFPAELVTKGHQRDFDLRRDHTVTPRMRKPKVCKIRPGWACIRLLPSISED